MTTVGEAMVGRALRRERRAGVEHYVPGQHAAVEDPDLPGVYLLSYVDQLGYAVVIPCEWEGNHWKAVRIALRAGQETIRTSALRDDFELSPRMLAALNRTVGR